MLYVQTGIISDKNNYVREVLKCSPPISISSWHTRGPLCVDPGPSTGLLHGATRLTLPPSGNRRMALYAPVQHHREPHICTLEMNFGTLSVCV